MLLSVCGRELGCTAGVEPKRGLVGGELSGSKEGTEVEDGVDDEEEGRTDCSVNMNCRGNKSERMIPMKCCTTKHRRVKVSFVEENGRRDVHCRRQQRQEKTAEERCDQNGNCSR